MYCNFDSLIGGSKGPIGYQYYECTCSSHRVRSLRHDFTSRYGALGDERLSGGGSKDSAWAVRTYRV
jgi:hypothetical protein